MENTTKAILIGVGLFITIALISAVLVIMGVGNNLIRNSSDNLTGIASQLEKSLTENFDDKRVSGSEVASCIKEYYSSNKLSILLANNISAATLTGKVGAKDLAISGATFEATADSLEGDYLADADKIALNKISDPTAVEYIRPQAQYQANLIRFNGNIVGIYFKKVS